VTDEVKNKEKSMIFLLLFIKTPHPSAKLTPSPQGEG
jgi:hypothetical protein